MVVTASELLSPAKNPCNPNNLGCNADKYEPMWTISDVVLSNSDQSCHALRLLGGLQNLCDIGPIRGGVVLIFFAGIKKIIGVRHKLHNHR